MGDWQTKAGSLMALVEARIDLAKGAHRRVNLSQRHPQSSVADTDAGEICRTQANVNADAALGGSEFDGVAEEIDQNLLEAERIGQKIWNVRHDVGFNEDVLFAGLSFDNK